MKTATGVQTGTYTVQFTRRPPMAREVASPGPTGRLPRVTHLLVLAHKIERLIRAGEIRDWAEAARLAGVTRARMTQIANLLLLAPTLQEALLDRQQAPVTSDRMTERSLRPMLSSPEWAEQRTMIEAAREG